MCTIPRIHQIALLAPLAFAWQISLAEAYIGRVIGVSDGDTITVLDNSNTQHKIRLAGIDAPEKSQAFGQRSKENLSVLVFGKSVLVDSRKNDRYGRSIGKITVNGQDANLAQIRAGFAWHYKAYEKEQLPADRAAYSQAETDARRRRAGVWQDSMPIPPWDFRHGTRGAPADRRVLVGELCPCGSGATCTGPKGGIYCLTDGGSKKYR